MSVLLFNQYAYNRLSVFFCLFVLFFFQVLVRHSLVDQRSQSVYRLIGWLVVVQLVLSLARWLWRWQAGSERQFTTDSQTRYEGSR
jgi:hypothetical protein